MSEMWGILHKLVVFITLLMLLISGKLIVPPHFWIDSELQGRRKLCCLRIHILQMCPDCCPLKPVPPVKITLLVSAHFVHGSLSCHEAAARMYLTVPWGLGHSCEGYLKTLKQGHLHC
jgi:hypothetical protein